MEEEKSDIYHFFKNKKIVYCLIVIITLYLYYDVKNKEENIEKLRGKKKFVVIEKQQIENDIHLNNSKLLNMKINKEYIEKLILSEMKNKKNKNNDEQEIELWKIETFFLTLFCAIFGWLYYYSSQETEKINKIDKNYIYENDYTRYFLEESELDNLINNSEKDKYNYI